MGGIAIALIVDLLSATWEQPAQTKMCRMVVASTSVERVQFISVAQFGQFGGSSCSKDLLSLSTMISPFLLVTYAQLRAVLQTRQNAGTSGEQIWQMRATGGWDGNCPFEGYADFIE